MRLSTNLSFKSEAVIATLTVRRQDICDVDDSIQRTIQAWVDEKGPIWDEFADQWFTRPIALYDHEGHTYCNVRHLQIDADLYPSWVGLSIDGYHVRIQTMERYEGFDVEEFMDDLQGRNKVHLNAIWLLEEEAVTRRQYSEVVGSFFPADTPNLDVPYTQYEKERLKRTHRNVIRQARPWDKERVIERKMPWMPWEQERVLHGYKVEVP